MELRSLREEALYETARFFSENRSVAPDQDSEEWEEEYRRQFERVKRRHANEPAGRAQRSVPAPATEERVDDGPHINGPDSERRWAQTLRAERLKEIKNADMRRWAAEEPGRRRRTGWARARCRRKCSCAGWRRTMPRTAAGSKRRSARCRRSSSARPRRRGDRSPDP